MEILFESNKAPDLVHLRRIWLRDAREQFWVVAPFEQIVEVYEKDGSWHEFRRDQTLQIPFAGHAQEILVSGIFR